MATHESRATSSPHRVMLCADTLTHTMLFLNAKTVALSCTLVSRQWNRCAKSNIVWKLFYEVYFMSNLFGWESLMNDENSSSDGDDEDDENDRKSKKRTVPICKEEQTKKKQKIENINSLDSDSYWFDLFKKCLIFPILDRDHADIQSYVHSDTSQVDDIDDVVKLRQIIHHLKDVINSGDVQLIDTVQYKCERPPNPKNEELRVSYLKLAVILTIIFEGLPISYFFDNVVISLKKLTRSSKKTNDSMLCPLPAFCMLILYPKAQKNLPFEESNDSYFCVAQHIKGNKANKDCCFFTQMEEDVQCRNELEVEYAKDSSDEQGFDWCPTFFNAGGAQYSSKIQAVFEEDNCVQVKKFEQASYC